MPVTVIAARKDVQHVYALTESAGVFRWDSAASLWENASNGLPVPFFHRTEGSLLAVDPAEGNRVYTLLNVPVNSHRDQRLLFGSVDGGRNWSLLKELGAGRSLVHLRVGGKGRLSVMSGVGVVRALD